MGEAYLKSAISCLNGLLSFIQKDCINWDGAHLTRAVWEEYAVKMERVPRRRRHLIAYSAITELYLPDYVESLDPALLSRIASYLLPRLPARFLEQHAKTSEIYAEEQRRRKEKSDVLAPLHTLLVALIQLRKQAAWRLLSVFRQACSRAEGGESLPLRFSYEDVQTSLNRHARTIAEVQLEKRTVVLEFLLWNRQAWIRSHPEEVGKTTRQYAMSKSAAYQPEREQYFVEFLGQPSELLWVGDLLAQGLLMRLNDPRSGPRLPERQEQHLRRRADACTFGALRGFCVTRPGLLTPPGGFGRWLALRYQAMLFDPEGLYRGILYGAALATIALTNGSRLAELLQVSADRFKGHPYEEKVGGQPTGKQRVIWLQYLLPKGKKTEAERQLFPISPQSYELLREIGTHLKETYGCIPTVCPHPDNTKAEDLGPERYLFQWAATSDGREGALSPGDVSVLIRLILHGLEFRTAQGEPFVVSAHLL